MGLNVHVQWAKAKAGGYITIPVEEWSGLPKKAKPLPVNAKLDSAPGLIAHVCIFGHLMAEDHASVEPLPDGAVHMCGWSNNAMPDGSPLAKSVVIGEDIVESVWQRTSPGVVETFTMRGPYQSVVFYCSKEHWPSDPVYCFGFKLDFLPWEDFEPPAESVTRHGILMPDALWTKHSKFLHPEDLPT